MRKATVNDAAAGRVHRPASLLVHHEEALIDPFVDENHSNLWLCGHLVVESLDCLLELLDFESKNLLTLGITNTVTVDDQVCGELTLVVFSEALKSLLEFFLELVFDNFLALLLDNVVRVVLGHVFVDRGRETDNRL